MTNYPANWEVYCQYVGLAGADAFGFTQDIGNVNRFGARFRAAKSFNGVNLDGYSHDTAEGYSALCRVLFVWSAFESFMRILDIRQDETTELLDTHGGLETLQQLRDLDTDEGFYSFIYERVNSRHKQELDTYHNNDSCNITYLASSIRHIFSHGHLTPNANNVEPMECIQICNVLSEFLLFVMDREFGNRIASFVDEIYRR